jgi:prolyl-tRNA synthetase
LNIPIYADYSVFGMKNFVVGANEKDHHYIGVELGDFNIARFGDIRMAMTGDACPRCSGKLTECRGIEVGQVFFLGKKYSHSMGATYLDEKGESKEMVMGCYGIGIGRTAAAAIEQNCDDKGIIWPLP